MKKSGKKLNVFSLNLLLVCLSLFIAFTGCKKQETKPKPQLSITTVASGLPGVMGITTDHQGNIWVSEGGTDTVGNKGNTHNNDGKVVVITPGGKQYDAVIHLSSYANVYSGELQGTVHLLMDGGTLYILSGDDLYTADVSHFNPGDDPIEATTLPQENIASFASQNALTYNPEHDSHPYALAIGPEGDLYIADAGANAILHRKGENDYTVLAEIPSSPNPTPQMGGPVIQAVPTSIMWDGHEFLVTTLTGFPFLAGRAIVYKVSSSGEVSAYQKGFTMLVDQAPGKGTKHLVVQYASSFNPASGYAPNSGALIWVNGATTEVLADGLNQPVSITQVNKNTWYLTSLGDASVLKVSYQ